MLGAEMFQLMLIHCLFIHLETVLHCAVQFAHSLGMTNVVHMQKFQKFLLAVVYLYFLLVFQHMMIFGVHVMEYYQLILHIVIQFFFFWLLQQVKLLLTVANMHLLIYIPCLKYIYDTILFNTDGMKDILITTSIATAASFNSSLNDVITSKFNAFGIITMILSLLQLITVLVLHGIIFLIGMECTRVFCFVKQFLALFWKKSGTVSLDLTQITINLVGFASLASQLVKLDVIYAILVIFGCLGAGIMYYIAISHGINTAGINTTVMNENGRNLIKFDIISVGIDVIIILLLNLLCLIRILLISIKYLVIYSVTSDSYNGCKDVFVLVGCELFVV